MMVELFPASGIIATRNRAATLRRTLESLAKQLWQPEEIVIVDASDGTETQILREVPVVGLFSNVRWLKATERGAGAQRNQGVAAATEAIIWFFDDDILFEANCVQHLWNAVKSDRLLGGVNAMIVNQRYQTPGAISRFMFTLMHGRAEETFAGKVIGPAINLLPEDREDLPAVVPVEWLNTTCTIYRHEALPSPVFDEVFRGYSLMEDVTLSLRVAQGGWKLGNVRTARVFHDSQAGEHKSDTSEVAAMELRNRYYVMTNILHKTGFLDYVRFAIWELFSVASGCASPEGWKNLKLVLAGKWEALRKLRNMG